MSTHQANPMSYPIVIRLSQVRGEMYVEASQPDLGIYRARWKFAEIKRREEIGAIIMEMWQEILDRHKKEPHAFMIPPSSPKDAVRSGSTRTMTTKHAAAILGVSDATVRRMCEAGKLKAFRTAGGHWRIKREGKIAELDTLVANVII